MNEQLAPDAIDWKRVAAPQSDDYDSRVTLHFAHRNGYARPHHKGRSTLFDSAVAAVDDSTVFPLPCVPAELCHPNIRRAEEALRLWPEGWQQCRLLLDSVELFFDPCSPEDQVVGCISGPGRSGFGSVAATINNHVGLAEAIIHEMGHHKMHALGVHLEDAERLILNAPEEKFRSPIRYDCLRPMPAVLQAQYSYTYVAALDNAIIRAGKDEKRDRIIAQNSLAVILPKLEFGRREIETHARVDANGAAFLEGLFDWLDKVLTDGHAILQRFEIAPQAFEYLLHQSTASAGVLRREPIPVQSKTLLKESLWDGTAFVYSTQQHKLFSLNAAANAIWGLCDGARTAHDISRELSLVCDIDSAQLLPDVQTTLQQLAGNGLLEWR